MPVTELDFARLAPEAHKKSTFSGPTGTDDELDRPARVSHLQALMKTIEGEIIPRLLLVFSKDELDAMSVDGWQSIVESDITTFAELLLSTDAQECINYVELLRTKGLGLDAIFLELFAPAARLLGTLWTQDLRTFSDVTMGLGTLQRVFRHYTPTFEGNHAVRSGRRAFLVPGPGEQHTFGLFVVETFLHRAGWQVDTLPTFDPAEVRQFFRNNTVQLIGISVSCERFLHDVAPAIDMMRTESADRGAIVMAGGKLFQSTPALAKEVGADASADDADQAVRRADQLVPWPIGDEYRRRIN